MSRRAMAYTNSTAVDGIFLVGENVDSHGTDATATLCATVAREYPAIVAAIDERNIYNREPWTNPQLCLSTVSA